MRYNARTDLAIESLEALRQPVEEFSEKEGIIARRVEKDGFAITKVQILTQEAADRIGKPPGRYFTVEGESAADMAPELIHQYAAVCAELLAELIGDAGANGALIIGLGNPNALPDTLGPETVRRIIVTRHLKDLEGDLFKDIAEVSALSAGVPGITGIESSEFVVSVARQIHPQLIIAVDAITTSSLARLCNSIQFTDVGIIPGSGVGNSRKAINAETTGVPVVAIGFPTVVSTQVIINEFLENCAPQMESPEDCAGLPDLLVSPRDVDLRIKHIANVLGIAVNRVLHPELEEEEIYQMMGA